MSLHSLKYHFEFFAPQNRKHLYRMAQGSTLNGQGVTGSSTKTRLMTLLPKRSLRKQTGRALIDWTVFALFVMVFLETTSKRPRKQKLSLVAMAKNIGHMCVCWKFQVSLGHKLVKQASGERMIFGGRWARSRVRLQILDGRFFRLCG